jgi:hypothetical protein
VLPKTTPIDFVELSKEASPRVIKEGGLKGLDG